MASLGTGRILATAVSLGMLAAACQRSRATDVGDGAIAAGGPKDAASKADPDADAAIAADIVADIVADMAAERAVDVGAPTRVDMAPDGNRAPEPQQDAATSVFADAGLDAPVRPEVEAGQVDGGAAEDAAAFRDGALRYDGALGFDGALVVNPSPLCQGIFIDNSGPPKDYPVVYREEASANTAFESEKARLISTFHLAASDYTITAAPITWAASIEKQGAGDVTVSGPIDESTTTAVVTGFLSEWDGFFKYAGILTSHDDPYCFNKFCQVTLSQDYCGLPLHSSESTYDGSTSAFLYFTPIQAVYRIFSHFVPMLPVPRNVVLSDEQVKQAVIGRTFTYACKDGQHSSTVTSKDQLTVQSSRAMDVRTSPTVAAALEYRLVIPTLAQIGSLAWVVYVDGIDGTVVDDVAGFICD